MNKTTTLLYSIAAITLGTSAVFAESRREKFELDELESVTLADKLYIRANVASLVPGNTEVRDTVGAGWGGMAAVGYEVGIDELAGFQVEVESGWIEMKGNPATPGVFSSVTLDEIPMLISARYVLYAGKGWQFSAGPSIGAAYLRGKVSASAGGGSVTVSDSDLVFAGGLGLMATYAFNEHLAVDAGYRYLWTTRAMFDMGAGQQLRVESLGGHLFQIGARVSF